MDYKEIRDYIKSHHQMNMSMKEYIYTGLNNKSLILQLEDYKVIRAIDENEYISREDIEEYYNDLLDHIDIESMHMVPGVRLYVEGDGEKYIIHLNEWAISTGLQEVDLYTEETPEGFEGIKPWI